jgi:hypothetical protein
MAMAIKISNSATYYATRAVNYFVTTVGAGYIALGIGAHLYDEPQLAKNSTLFGAVLVMTQIPAFFYIKKEQEEEKEQQKEGQKPQQARLARLRDLESRLK